MTCTHSHLHGFTPPLSDRTKCRITGHTYNLSSGADVNEPGATPWKVYGERTGELPSSGANSDKWEMGDRREVNRCIFLLFPFHRLFQGCDPSLRPWHRTTMAQRFYPLSWLLFLLMACGKQRQHNTSHCIACLAFFFPFTFLSLYPPHTHIKRISTLILTPGSIS